MSHPVPLSTSRDAHAGLSSRARTPPCIKRVSKVQHQQVVTEITSFFFFGWVGELKSTLCQREFCLKAHLDYLYVLPCIYKNGSLYMIKEPFTVMSCQAALLLSRIPRAGFNRVPLVQAKYRGMDL